MCKLLFVTHEKERNGSANSMITLVGELSKEYGYDIEVLLPERGAAEKALNEMEIKTTVFFYLNDWKHMGKRSILKSFIKDRINEFATWRLYFKLKVTDYDYIISNSTAVDIGARAAIRAKKKHIYYVREFMEEDFSFEYRNQKRMKTLFEESDRVIFISNAIAEKYRKKYLLKKSEIIYNGIDYQKYYIKRDDVLSREEIRLIQVGTISDGKGSMSSIKYIEKIKGLVKCHLTLVGRGKEKYIQTLQQYIDLHDLCDYVSVLPYTNDIKDLLKTKDILLVNSKSEGFGRVTVEGMLGGLLAVGRDTGGTVEIINHEKTGMLFHDESDFIHIMCDINEQRLKYKAMAICGQESAMRRFSHITNAKAVDAFLREKSNAY